MYKIPLGYIEKSIKYILDQQKDGEILQYFIKKNARIEYRNF